MLYQTYNSCIAKLPHVLNYQSWQEDLQEMNIIDNGEDARTTAVIIPARDNLSHIFHCSLSMFTRWRHMRFLFNWPFFWRLLEIKPHPSCGFQRRAFGDCWCEMFHSPLQMPFRSPNQQCQSTEGS